MANIADPMTLIHLSFDGKSQDLESTRQEPVEIHLLPRDGPIPGLLR
jgi:hypothetical protein